MASYVSALDTMFHRPDGPAVSAPSTVGSGRVAWLATLRNKGPRPLERSHIAWEPYVTEPILLHLVVLDVSGSMLRGDALARAKGCAQWLLWQAQRQGAWVGVMTFGGQGAAWLQPPVRAQRRIHVRLRAQGGGGGTPLRQALALAGETAVRFARLHPGSQTTLWLLTDGRYPEVPSKPPLQRVCIIDFEDTRPQIGRAAEWAQHWGATCIRG